MNTELKALINKLNPTCRTTFTATVDLCVKQTYYHIEIEHILLKFLEQPKNDILILLQYYHISINGLQRELQTALEKFKRGSERTPIMSPYVITLLRESWLISSLRLYNNHIRSSALFIALFECDEVRNSLLETLPLLKTIPRETINEDLFKILKESPENISTHQIMLEELKPASLPSQTPTSLPPPASAPLTAPHTMLAQFTQDLTAAARTGKFDDIIGRDDEIRQIMDILLRRRQNNPLIIGEAGVGKTAVVEGLAARIARGDVPPQLQNTLVLNLDLTLLQAGASLRGEFENRLKSVINDIIHSTQPIILFIDEAHSLIGAGGAAGQQDAANILKPALARGELRTIAATTLAEYKRYLAKDPALTRRFQLVQVDEPSIPVTIAMLRNILKSLEKHHQVFITEAALQEAVMLSQRYLSGRQLPDKAVSVLDTACARIKLEQSNTPTLLEAIQNRIIRIEQEQLLQEREEFLKNTQTTQNNTLLTALEQLKMFEKQIYKRWQAELQLVKRWNELALILQTDKTKQVELNQIEQTLTQIQGKQPLISLKVDAPTVASVIADWTGIPVDKMLADEIQKILNLETELQKRIIGQHYALKMISRRLQSYHAKLDNPQNPVGVFLLVGSSGVGKTETALVLADLLYGGEENLITLNMSEYQESHTASLLKGAPPGYVGYGQGGILTEAVRRKPYSVILLDEVEKAHSDVLEIFYQVFDKGRMQDSEGLTANFQNTLILLTSNLATETILNLWHSNPDISVAEIETAIRPELNAHFKPALLARMVVVPYFPLQEQAIRQIASLKLEKLQKRFIEHHKTQLNYDESVLEFLVKRCIQSESGARQLEHLLNEYLLPSLSVEILQRMTNEEKFNKVDIHYTTETGLITQFIFDPALNFQESPLIPQELLENNLDLVGLLKWLKSKD